MKDAAGRGKCYPLRLKAKVDNTLRDLQNSSYPTKAKFNHIALLFIQNIFKLLKEKMSFIFKNCTPSNNFNNFVKITQPCPQVFLVNGSIICSGLHF